MSSAVMKRIFGLEAVVPEAGAAEDMLTTRKSRKSERTRCDPGWMLTLDFMVVARLIDPGSADKGLLPPIDCGRSPRAKDVSVVDLWKRSLV